MIQNERLSQGGGESRDISNWLQTPFSAKKTSPLLFLSTKILVFVPSHTVVIVCFFPVSSLEGAGGNAPQATRNRVIRCACRCFFVCHRSEVKACFTVAYTTDEQARDNGDSGLWNLSFFLAGQVHSSRRLWPAEEQRRPNEQPCTGSSD